MSDSYRRMLTDSAYIAGLGQDVGLDLDEVVDGLLTAKEKKEGRAKEMALGYF